MNFRILIILILSFLWSCQNKLSDNIVGSTNALDSEQQNSNILNPSVQLEILNILSKVPETNNDFHFATTPDTVDREKLIYLSKDVLNRLELKNIFYSEFGKREKVKSIGEIREAHQASESFQVGFYRKLNHDDKTIDVLVAFIFQYFKGNNQLTEWYILTFDKNGNQLSALDRFNEFYLINDTIIGLYWYASNYDPHYETWIKKNGEFEMIEQSEKEPEQFKRRMNGL